MSKIQFYTTAWLQVAEPSGSGISQPKNPVGREAAAEFDAASLLVYIA
jgi:hypothetical protein